jgi:hypothetical protein
MNNYVSLRAYMAGIAVPTVFLLVVMTFFTLARYVYNIPVAVERVIVFPMALVPNLWGVWNILYVRLRPRWPLGVHGAAMPFVILPAAVLLTRLTAFDVPAFVSTALPVGFPITVAVYYLAWKYIVGFLNRVEAI